MATIVCKIKKVCFIFISLVILFALGLFHLGFCSDEAVVAKGVDWNYALTSLVIRFIGVFAVLGILQVAIQIAGRLFARIERNNHKKALQAEGVSKGLTPQEVAAVSIALHLYRRQR
jgi:Na+-transporting methylmalonyl-CoA/oxaloacetate decarboxylase gamma subunit